jgi:Xaa-Pro aminopeptidase
VKTEEEITRLARAAEIAEQAARAAIEASAPGVRTAELERIYRRELGVKGADFDHFAFDVKGWGIATGIDRALTPGETLYFDFGCMLEHYFSDSGFTVSIGDPPDRFVSYHTALREAMNAAIPLLRPGTPSSAAAVAMREALAGHGITWANPHGHGLGLEVRDYPILVPNNGLRIRDACVDVPSDLPLEADMVVNLECALFFGGDGSVQTEQTFVVTGEGGRLLVPQEREHPYAGSLYAGKESASLRAPVRPV